jgi:predicted RNase H-like nuclease (RuvC/YqgF family)
MSNCKVQGCPNVGIAKGLCAKHYMRARRTGDPSVRLKPGPKPKPGSRINVLSALERELEQLKSENAELRRRGGKVGPVSASERELERLKSENAELLRRAASGLEVIASLRRQLAAAQAKSAKPKQPASPITPSEEVAALQRQLVAARTRIRNLTAEVRSASDTRNEALNAPKNTP